LGKQSLARRIQNAIVSENPKGIWEKIQADFPDRCKDIEAAWGTIPSATLDDISLDKAVRYAARDADCTCRVDPHLTQIHSALNLAKVEEIDLAVIPYYERMHRNGTMVDPQHFHDFGQYLDALLDLKGSEIDSLVGEHVEMGHVNPNSGDQVAELLYRKLGLTTTRMTKSRKRESTDEKALQGNRKKHPIVPMILDYRELQKLKGTYVDGMLPWVHDDGRIYSRFSLTSSPNGQTAAYDPNLLAIPVASEIGKEIRRGFIAPEGCVLGTFDLDQWFLRVTAHLSGDAKLIDMFHSGKDIHTETAAEIFKIPVSKVDKNKHRGPAKRTGFGICNGITGVGLSAQFDKYQELGGDPRTVEECDWLIESWLDIYSGVRAWQKKEMEFCRRHGYVKDMFGRIRYLPNIHSAIESLKAEAERQSFTHVVQSSAHCLKKIMEASIWQWLLEFWRDFSEFRLEPILEVHDELLFELTDNDFLKTYAGNEIKEIMETAYPLVVPIGVHVAFANNWASLEK
jgi:DNA polymerase-1